MRIMVFCRWRILQQVITDVYDLMHLYDNYIVGEYVRRWSMRCLVFREQRSVRSNGLFTSAGLLQCSRFLDEKPEWTGQPAEYSG